MLSNYTQNGSTIISQTLQTDRIISTFVCVTTWAKMKQTPEKTDPKYFLMLHALNPTYIQRSVV
jgi:hypothetical protein